MVFPSSISNRSAIITATIPTDDITSSIQEENTLKVQGDEVIESEVKVQGGEVIYEAKVHREIDGTREQQQPQWQQQPQQTRLQQPQQDHKTFVEGSRWQVR